MSELTDHLELMIAALVDEPDEVEVDEDELDGTTVLQVRVADDDLGKVIGRQGRTVRALRNLLEVRGSEDDEYYDLEIVED